MLTILGNLTKVSCSRLGISESISTCCGSLGNSVRHGWLTFCDNAGVKKKSQLEIKIVYKINLTKDAMR